MDARLALLAEASPQVFLRADRALDYGRVMRIMGELSRAGLTRVALVTAESASESPRNSSIESAGTDAAR